MKAKLIKDNLPKWNGHAALYELDPPMTDNEKTHKHVVVSATVAMFSGPETYIFPANENGEVLEWGELASYRGGMNHAEALEGAGYSVFKHDADAVETALADRWERRLRLITAAPGQSTTYFQGLLDAHEACLKDLRAVGAVKVRDVLPGVFKS